jgi:hypothetical protein
MINHKNKHELNPCPFCGSKDLDVTQWIECNGCGAFGPTPGDDGDLSAWNQLRGVVVTLPPEFPLRAFPRAAPTRGETLRECSDAVESAGATAVRS